METYLLWLESSAVDLILAIGILCLKGLYKLALVYLMVFGRGLIVQIGKESSLELARHAWLAVGTHERQLVRQMHQRCMRGWSQGRSTCVLDCWSNIIRKIK